MIPVRNDVLDFMSGGTPRISAEGGLRGLWVSPEAPLAGTVMSFGQQGTCTFRPDGAEDKLGVPLGHIIPGYITTGDFGTIPKHASLGMLRDPVKKRTIKDQKAINLLLVRRMLVAESVVENGGRITRYDLTPLGWYIARWAGWL